MIRVFDPYKVNVGDSIIVTSLDSVASECEVLGIELYKNQVHPEGRLIFTVKAFNPPAEWLPTVLNSSASDMSGEFKCDMGHCNLPINLIMADIMSDIQTI